MLRKLTNKIFCFCCLCECVPVCVCVCTFAHSCSDIEQIELANISLGPTFPRKQTPKKFLLPIDISQRFYCIGEFGCWIDWRIPIWICFGNIRWDKIRRQFFLWGNYWLDHWFVWINVFFINDLMKMLWGRVSVSYPVNH